MFFRADSNVHCIHGSFPARDAGQNPGQTCAPKHGQQIAPKTRRQTLSTRCAGSHTCSPWVSLLRWANSWRIYCMESSSKFIDNQVKPARKVKSPPKKTWSCKFTRQNNTCWLVYLLSPVFPEKLHGFFVDVLSLFSGQFSIRFPDEISMKKPWTPGTPLIPRLNTPKRVK